MSTDTKSPIQLHALTVRFLLGEVDTGGAATVFETVVPASAFVPPPHGHDGFEETIYVQRGTFTVTIDGTSQEIGAGHAAFIGRGQVHSFDIPAGSTGPSCQWPARVFSGRPTSWRSTRCSRLRLMAAPNKGAMFAVMQRHGLTPALPGLLAAPAN
jgi:quercetin dioxygenase-like cupin family protein